MKEHGAVCVMMDGTMVQLELRAEISVFLLKVIRVIIMYINAYLLCVWVF